MANRFGAIVAVHLPLEWLLQSNWNFDYRADGIQAFQDLPPDFIVDVEFLKQPTR